MYLRNKHSGLNFIMQKIRNTKNFKHISKMTMFFLFLNGGSSSSEKI